MTRQTVTVTLNPATVEILDELRERLCTSRSGIVELFVRGANVRELAGMSGIIPKSAQMPLPLPPEES